MSTERDLWELREYTEEETLKESELRLALKRKEIHMKTRGKNSANLFSLKQTSSHLDTLTRLPSSHVSIYNLDFYPGSHQPG